MILAPWAGEGSLDSATVAEMAAAEREGWAALRSLQGDPEIDVLRYTSSAGDPSRGVSPTRTPVEDLSGLPVLRGDVTPEEAESRGVTMAQGMVSFELFTDVEVLLTDLLRFPAGSGPVYAVVRAFYDSNIGQSVVYARPAPAGGS